MTLARELSWAVLIKLIAIMAIWYIWFSGPDQRVDPLNLVLASPVNEQGMSSIPAAREVDHDQ